MTMMMMRTTTMMMVFSFSLMILSQLNSLFYVATDVRMIMNDELGRMWKEVVVTYFMVVSQIFLKSLRETMETCWKS
jgi:hypothetical protein